MRRPYRHGIKCPAITSVVVPLKDPSDGNEIQKARMAALRCIRTKRAPLIVNVNAEKKMLLLVACESSKLTDGRAYLFRKDITLPEGST